MKKISLGSFPLVDLDGKERKYIDSYLIKVLSDLITVNQLSNSIYMDRAKYITPISIMEFIKENKGNSSGPNQPYSDSMDTERLVKANVIKHAFKNTKKLYQALSADPFYRTNIFFPIYIEEPIKSSSGYLDYNYDFLILSNDLVKQQLLDEIIYDDKITMLFLVLKCLIAPNMKVTDIGTNQNNGANFRKYFSVFLETCKNENINPFDMFIKIVKAAGMGKRSKQHGLFGDLSQRVSGMGTSPGRFHSSTFLNLFDAHGEIKDASFLTNVSLDQINSFIAENNKALENYNPMLRQYAQAKTHEYGKILSIVDALRAFNLSSNIMEEINSNTLISKISVKDANGEDTLLSINKEAIINELETTLFRAFLDEIGKLDENRINFTRSELVKNFKTDIYNAIPNLSNVKNNNGKTYIQNLKDEVIRLKDVAQTIKQGAIRTMDLAGFTLPEERDQEIARQLKDNNNVDPSIIDYQNKIKEIQQKEAELVTLNGYNTSMNATIKSVETEAKISLKVNLEIIQAYLTTLYSELYEYIYSDQFDSDIQMLQSETKNVQTIDARLFNPGLLSKNMSAIQITLSETRESFNSDASGNFRRYVQNDLAGELDQSTLKGLLNYKVNGIGDQALREALVKTVFLPIFTKYTNLAVSKSSQIKDLKVNNNPLIKKLLQNQNSFKAFILNEETLIASYEILHYIDTLKFEEGLIPHPVSKVMNPQNKILFMLTRLGLNNNPVFIFTKGRIILSMPANLSMTGMNFLSSIPLTEFTKVGSINWGKDLWNQDLMFGGVRESIKYKSTQASIDKIKSEIKLASEELKTLTDAKDKKKKQAEIDRKKAELLDKQSKFDDFSSTQRESNFTSNTDTFKRDENTRVMNGPRFGGRYNSNMDPNGNYRYENNQINNQRNQMDYLRQQNFQPQTQNYPQQSQQTVETINPNNYFQRPQNNYPQDNQYYPENNYNQPGQRPGLFDNEYVRNRQSELNQR